VARGTGGTGSGGVSGQHPAPMPPVFTAPSAASSPVPVSPGRQQVTVNVTAVFALG
jgi:uncharacterized protein YggE